MLLANTGEVKTLTLALEGRYFDYRPLSFTHCINTHNELIPCLIANVQNSLRGGDSNTVFAMLMKILEENKVPMDKIIGICSDGASTMLGVHKGVCTQLPKKICAERKVIMNNMVAHDRTRTMDLFHVNRGVFVVHCVCHRLALILTDAIKGSKSCAKVIPDDVINLMNMVYNYLRAAHNETKQ